MPQATIWPRSMMPTRSHSRSTSSSSWLEKMTGTPASACSRSTPAHHVDGDRIEPGERLVEHEHVRTEDECGGQLDALLVAQAERLEVGVAPVGETEPVQPAERGLPGFRARHAVQLAEVGQLLGHAHLGIEAALLGHVADAAAGLEGQGHAQPAHHAGIRREHAQHDPHRGRLAGAVAPDEAEQLAGADVEGEVLHGDDVAVALRDLVDLRPRHFG